MLDSLIILALNQTNSLPEELLLQITTELKSGNHYDLSVTEVRNMDGLFLIFKSIIEELDGYQLIVDDLWFEFLVNEEGNITYEDFFAEIKTSLELISEIRDELGMMGESIG